MGDQLLSSSLRPSLKRQRLSVSGPLRSTFGSLPAGGIDSDAELAEAVDAAVAGWGSPNREEESGMSDNVHASSNNSHLSSANSHLSSDNSHASSDTAIHTAVADAASDSPPPLSDSHQPVSDSPTPAADNATGSAAAPVTPDSGPSDKPSSASVSVERTAAAPADSNRRLSDNPLYENPEESVPPSAKNAGAATEAKAVSAEGSTIDTQHNRSKAVPSSHSRVAPPNETGVPQPPAATTPQAGANRRGQNEKAVSITAGKEVSVAAEKEASIAAWPPAHTNAMWRSLQRPDSTTKKVSSATSSPERQPQTKMKLLREGLPLKKVALKEAALKEAALKEAGGAMCTQSSCSSSHKSRRTRGMGSSPLRVSAAAVTVALVVGLIGHLACYDSGTQTFSRDVGMHRCSVRLVTFYGCLTAGSPKFIFV